MIRDTVFTVPRDHRVVNGRGKDRCKPGRGNNQKAPIAIWYKVKG